MRGCPAFLFRFQNARIPNYSAYTLFQPDGQASGSPSATARPWAAHPCLCGRMLRDSNILPQSHPKQGSRSAPAVFWKAIEQMAQESKKKIYMQKKIRVAGKAIGEMAQE